MAARGAWSFAAAVVLVAAMVPSARAAETILCGRSGTVTVEPGLTMVPQKFSATDVGTFGPCQMPDGSIESGKVFATGEGEGTCASVRATASFTISWSNGTTSKGTAEAVSLAPMVVLVPEVTEAPFAGGPAHTVIFLSPEDPSACGSGGLTEVPYQGWISFSG